MKDNEDMKIPHSSPSMPVKNTRSMPDDAKPMIPPSCDMLKMCVMWWCKFMPIFGANACLPALLSPC